MVRAIDIRKSFGSLEVLKGINLDIAKGEVVSIVGASGAGKTTLLQILSSLDKPTSGQVFIDNIDINLHNDKQLAKFRNQQIGFVFQFHHLLPEFTALENVAMPLHIRRMPKEEANERAAAMLAEVGLSHRLDHTPSELSGGERQRAAIARALVTEPACVLADEPTGNLDRQTAEGVFELMLALNRSRQTSFVIVTHDPGLAGRADRILTLQDGRFL